MIAEELKKFLTEEQDPAAVEEIVGKVTQILTSQEVITYVAVQKKLVANKWPDAIVLTNRRLIVYCPKMFGRVTFDDFQWMDVRDVKLEENIVGATISATIVGRPTGVWVSSLPKAQARKVYAVAARKVYAVAQEMEEKARVARHQYDLETRRASAGGVVVSSAPAPPPPAPIAAAPDLMSRLRSLKEMLDAGLISQAEFDAKKAEIMAQL